MSFALIIFLGRLSSLWPRLTQDSNSPTSASHIAESTGTWHPPPNLLVELGSHTLFAWLTSNCNLPNLHLLSSWDYRCELPHLVLHFLLTRYKRTHTLSWEDLCSFFIWAFSQGLAEITSALYYHSLWEYKAHSVPEFLTQVKFNTC
jgi:hypothetical protein